MIFSSFVGLLSSAKDPTANNVNATKLKTPVISKTVKILLNYLNENVDVLIDGNYN